MGSIDIRGSQGDHNDHQASPSHQGSPPVDDSGSFLGPTSTITRHDKGCVRRVAPMEGTEPGTLELGIEGHEGHRLPHSQPPERAYAAGGLIDRATQPDAAPRPMFGLWVSR